jgi:outer membrane protein assembly factor BamB
MPCECNFGISLAAGGGSVLVGQIGNGPASVQRFAVDTGTLLDVLTAPIEPTTSSFGTSIALAGGRLLVGDPSALVGDHAAAFLFDVESGTLLATLTSPTPLGYGIFGYAVALLGTNAFVADASSRAVHVFDAATGAFLRTFAGPSGDAAFGRLLAALDPDLVVGGDGAVYQLDGATGAVRHVFRRPRDARFPSALAVIDGDILVGGSRAVYRFSATTGKLVRRYRGVERPLAVADGRLLASGPGCDESDVENDAAYLLDARSGRTLAVLCDPDADYLTRYGTTGAIVGDRIVVADPNEDINNVYVFAPCGGGLVSTRP